MRRILFVDDEPNILRALQILLRHNQQRWHMEFAVGGEAALAKLKEGYFDAIVADMRMPGIDGAALLKQVQERYPHMLRIILSAYTDLESVLRIVPVAHQFMVKPCDAAALENAIEKACSMQELIPDKDIRRMVGRINKLPSLPRVHTELIRTLSNPAATAAGVARILKQDIAMCAKLLQFVNSSFFQLAQRITNIDYAIVYLGFNMVKNLALSVGVFQAAKPEQEGFSMDLLQRHSLVTANIAARLLTHTEKSEDAFAAGLLHDIGKLIFVQEYPEHVERIRRAMFTDWRPEHLLEKERVGATHADVGAYLLGMWGLPDSAVQAVANHHTPERIKDVGFDVSAAVHVANQLANELMPSPNGTQNKQTIDRSYLASLGVSDRLKTWREIASEEVRRSMV